MPESLIHFRGDGETHVSEYIAGSHYKSLYNPIASVFHFIPKERMTVDYFCKRAYKQGVSDSYTAIRQTQGEILATSRHMILSKLKGRTKRLLDKTREKSLKEIPGVIWRSMEGYVSKLAITVAPTFLSHEKIQLTAVHREIALAYKTGYTFHQREIEKDPELLKWVLKNDYWDTELTAKWDKNQTGKQENVIVH